MKFIFLFLVSGLFMSKAAYGQSDEKDFIIRLSNDFFQAVKDRDSSTLLRMTAEEFVLMSSESNGEFINRRGYITGIMRPDILTVSSFRLTDFKIDFYDNIAIVHNRIDWKSMYRSKPWNAVFLNTDILHKRNGKWYFVARHTSYPASELKRIVVERG